MVTARANADKRSTLKLMNFDMLEWEDREGEVV
jgi:hypothetical protein